MLTYVLREVQGVLFDCFTPQAFPDATNAETHAKFSAFCGRAVCKELDLHRFPGSEVPPAVELQAGQI